MVREGCTAKEKRNPFRFEEEGIVLCGSGLETASPFGNKGEEPDAARDIWAPVGLSFVEAVWKPLLLFVGG